MKFYKRTPLDSSFSVIAGRTAENGTAEDRLNWLRYLIGYMPKFPNDLGDATEYPVLPPGVDRAQAGQTIGHERLRERCAVDAVANGLTDEIVGASVQKLTAEIGSHPGKYNKVIVVYPFHLNNAGSENYNLPVMAAALKEKLQEGYGNRIGGLPVVFDLEGDHGPGTPTLPLHVPIKRARGATKAKMDEPPLQVMVGNKLANQLIVDGTVDQKALYWLIDDVISIGGTVRNYAGYIQDKGSKVGVITTLNKRSKGADCIEVKPESLHALREIIRDKNPALAGRDEEKLQQILAAIGIEIDFNDTTATTATNQEVLLIAGYLANPGSAHHRALMDTALHAIGTSFAQASHSYAVKAAKLEEGSIEQLERMLCAALGIGALVETQPYIARY